MRKIAIEVGPSDGKDTGRLYTENSPIEKLFVFEAHPHWYNFTSNKYKSNPDIEIYHMAISDFDKDSVKFNECKLGGASSLLNFKSNEELIKEWGPLRNDIHASGKSFDVKCSRLDTFLINKGYTPENTSIEYLHVDAQGVDLEVVQSLGPFLSSLQKGVVETAYSSNKTIYSNQKCLLENTVEWLKSNNFEILEVKPNDRTNCECNVYYKKI